MLPSVALRQGKWLCCPTWLHCATRWYYPTWLCCATWWYCPTWLCCATWCCCPTWLSCATWCCCPTWLCCATWCCCPTFLCCATWCCCPRWGETGSRGRRAQTPHWSSTSSAPAQRSWMQRSYPAHKHPHQGFFIRCPFVYKQWSRSTTFWYKITDPEKVFNIL